MAITAAMVKDLREASGAGMMDCKKALTETDGNMEEAMEQLRKNGQAKAEKKASRIAAEGVCRIAVEGNGRAAVVEVNSETDFVAKNEKFTTYVENVAKQALSSKSQNMDEFMAEAWKEDTSKTVSETLVEMISVIGEKLSIRRYEVVEGSAVVGYLHGAGRIGVLVAADATVVNDAVMEALKNIAMQIAALNPKYIDKSEIAADFVDHEKEILMAQIMNDPNESKKPQKVIEGMVMGRISKELKEICLLDQVYVKAEDGKQTVAQYLVQVGKENGTEIKIPKFVRYETGEGLEKKNEDFAAEVAAQMNA